MYFSVATLLCNIEMQSTLTLMKYGGQIHLVIFVGWLVGCFGINGPLRQYFSLYRAVSQREGERGERIDESKMSKPPPSAPTVSAIGPCPTVIKIVGRPGTGSLPSTIAPPDHPVVIFVKDRCLTKVTTRIGDFKCPLSKSTAIMTVIFQLKKK